jgi:hypothetical protein
MLFGPAMALLVVAASPTVPVVVAVTDAGTCPSASAVEGDLARLLRSPRGDEPSAMAAPSPRHVRIEEVDAGVRVELLAWDGEVQATRVLPADRSCADLSVATAVVIATWVAQFDAGDGERFSVGPPPMSVPVPDLLAPPVLAAHAAVVAEARPARWRRLEIGLGFVTSVVGSIPALGARLEGRLEPFGQRLGIVLALSAVGARSASVGDEAGVVRWSRITAAAGPEYRLGGGPRSLSFHLLALAAALSVTGVGLPATHSDSSAQLGVGTGARAGWAWENAMAWVGADAMLFPGKDSLVIDGLPAAGALPRAELQLAAGVSVGRFR